MKHGNMKRPRIEPMELIKHEEKPINMLINSEMRRFLKYTRTERLPTDTYIGAFAERRVAALKATTKAVADEYPCPYVSAANEWVHLNCLAHTPLETLDEIIDFTSGAVIWILDHVTDYDALKGILPPKPTDEVYYSDVVHSDHAVLAVHHLITHRYDDARYISCVAKKDRQLSDEYQRLLDLIPKEMIEKAVSSFRAHFWGYVERLFDMFTAFSEHYTKSVEEYNTIAKAYNEKLKELNRYLQDRENKRAARKLNLVNEPVPPLPASLSSSPIPLTPDDVLEEMMRSFKDDPAVQCGRELDELDDRGVGILNRAMNERREMYSLGYYVTYNGLVTPNVYPNTLPKEVKAAFRPLKIEDPYELCFALYYLLDTGDHLPWLLGAVMGFLHHVGVHLPWVWERQGYEEKEGFDAEGPSWFTPQYKRPAADDEEMPMNLAQILYNFTGKILPRDMDKFDWVGDGLRDLGISDRDVPVMTSLMRLLTTEHPEVHVAQPSLNGLDAQEAIEALTAENKRLQDELHQEMRNARRATHLLETEREKAKADKAELAALRELVFKAGQEEESGEKLGISFPYEVKERTIVFGGHETWRTAMKEMLTGDIRFVDRDSMFDLDLVKNADVVWIQTNSISHKQYYRIIDIVRKNDVAVKYFLYAGARKCAEQVAMTSMAYT